MNKRLIITVLCFMAIAIACGWTLGWIITKTHKTITEYQNETSSLRKDLLETKKNLRKSLKNQIEHIDFLNRVHAITVDMELQEWRGAITVKGEVKNERL